MEKQDAVDIKDMLFEIAMQTSKLQTRKLPEFVSKDDVATIAAQYVEASQTQVTQMGGVKVVVLAFWQKRATTEWGFFPCCFCNKNKKLHWKHHALLTCPKCLAIELEIISGMHQDQSPKTIITELKKGAETRFKDYMNDSINHLNSTRLDKARKSARTELFKQPQKGHPE